MRRLADGALSAVAALLTLCIVGGPMYAATLALRSELVQVWFWAPTIVLGLCGLLMVLSFLRKAGRGVHPLRERRR